jgi:hypothetical protein
MITNKGKSIIGKYLLGNAPAYASYIALGSGAKPANFASEDIRILQNCYSEYWLVAGSTKNTDFNPRKIFIVDPTYDLPDSLIGATVKMNPVGINDLDAYDNNGRFSQSITTTIVSIDNDDTPLGGDPALHYKSIIISTDLEEYIYQGNILIQTSLEKETLDFEMFRIPITSKGYITENGVNKIVLTGELPSEERYEISEIGIYSAGANDEASSYDSKILFSFSEQESWQLVSNGSSSSASPTSVAFPIIYDKLTTTDDEFSAQASAAYAIQTNSNNSAFYTSSARDLRFERPRFLSNTYLMNGSNSHILNSKTYSGTLSSTTTATGTQLTGGTAGTNTFTCAIVTPTIKVGQSVTITSGTGAFATDTYVTAVTSALGVASVTLSANIVTSLSSGATITFKSSQITGLSSTTGLYAGMELRKVGGTGVFGGTALITSIDSSTQITLQTVSSNTSGSIIFLIKDATLNVLIPASTTGSELISNKNLTLNTQSVNLDRNSSSDLLKLAFTIINKDPASGNPDSVRIAVKFSNAIGDQYAIFGSESLAADHDFANNRYLVTTKPLSELEYSGTFSWNVITKAEIFSSALRNLAITNKARSTNVATLTSVGHGLYVGDIVTIRNVGSPFDGNFVINSTPTADTFTYLTTTSGTVTSSSATGYLEASTKDFWIALDALRLENISTNNPLYGLVGYSVVTTDTTLLKNANSTNYIEFRFALDVL